MLTRRLLQLASVVVLGSAIVLASAWAFPPGHLAIHVGRPEYSRIVGESELYVAVDLQLKNVGPEPVRIDREHFLAVDNRGHAYRADPSTHFLLNHFDVTYILPAREIRGVTIFKIARGRTLAELIYVTNTGQIVHFRL
jgi:Domain of unknown function (DUF4352)